MPNLIEQQNTAIANSGLIGNPLTSQSRENAIANAVALDELALFGPGNTGAFTDIYLTGLASPLNITIGQGGTAGSTDYSYVVAVLTNAGVAPSASTQTTAGNAILSTTNFNTISFASTLGYTYNVYRSASSGTPSGLGLIATVVGTGNTIVINDTGIVATAAEVYSANTSGGEVLSGPSMLAAVLSGGGNAGFGGVNIISSTTGVTLTPAELLGDLLIHGVPVGAINDTLPTAAKMVAAAGPNVRVGAVKNLIFRNEGTGSGVITLLAGAGFTIRAGSTVAIGAISAVQLIVEFTNVTPGSEACVLITGPVSAF